MRHATDGAFVGHATAIASARSAPESVDTTLRAGGAALDPGIRERMEQRLGHDFSRVRVHRDQAAGRSADELDARAYTVGRDVVFGPGEYAPDTPRGRTLLAHELTHVVQQDYGGRPTLLQRKVKTLGGEWDTDTYTDVSDGTDNIGVKIDLKFTPQPPVDATKIGLVQTANSIDKGKIVAVSETVKSRSIPKGEKGVEAGAHIDRLSAYGNPLYATGAPAPGDTLKATATEAFWGQHGWHFKDGAGVQQVQDAHLKDEPALPGRGKNASQIFESTALAVDGTQAGTYYGSVRWGWRTDDKGDFSRLPLSLVSAGVPSPTFMRSADLWNKGKTSTGADTIDLPTATVASGAIAPANRSTGDLVIWIEEVKAELARLPAGTDRTNKEFEKQALEAELAGRADKPTTTLAAEAAKAAALPTKDLIARLETVKKELFTAGLQGVLGALTGAPVAPDPAKTDKELEEHALVAELKTRKAKIEVKVISTEDWLGADHVYVKLKGDAGQEKSPVKKLNDGDSHVFLLPLGGTLSVPGALNLEVFDQDTPDADDLIVRMKWESPFGPAKNTVSFDEANYDVKLEFER
ncbi:MAG TPA: DUF4157 domain-containing protein [Gemmatimonadales bacterium]